MKIKIKIDSMLSLVKVEASTKEAVTMWMSQSKPTCEGGFLPRSRRGRTILRTDLRRLAGRLAAGGALLGLESAGYSVFQNKKSRDPKNDILHAIMTQTKSTRTREFLHSFENSRREMDGNEHN